MLKLIIAGNGFVGSAVNNALSVKHQTIVVDPKYSDISVSDHIDADGIIICVDTPNTEGGFCDPKNVFDVMDQVPVFMPVLIKSTVTPGVIGILEETYPDHSIVYSPELLRASSAKSDFLNQKYVILGGEDPECFWQEIFQKTLPNCKLVLNCTTKEASLVKYATNSFLALKTSYFNQLYDICEAEGLDFDIVRHIIGQDMRIGSDHTLVPGPDDQRGWGGHCFPKDTASFVHWSKTIGVDLTLVESAINYNKKVRKGS